MKRAISPAGESTDLDPDQGRRALEATRKAGEGKLDRQDNPRKPPPVAKGTLLSLRGARTLSGL